MALNIMSEWSEDGRPEKLMDKRSEVPRHKRLKWRKRSVSDIEGICVHQTLGGDNPVATANYHINHMPNGSGKGAPSVCYTFYIRRNGDIWWCNDMEDKTWSQGSGKIPGDENKKYLSIVLGGKFNGPTYKRGVEEPKLEQMLSLLQLIRWLCNNLELGYDQVYGHYDFGKTNCPGNTATALIEAINVDPAKKQGGWSDFDWQYALVRLGYDLGPYGPRKDGVDGDWGPSSTAALKKFQLDQKLSYVSGEQDKKTKSLLISSLRGKFGDSVELKWK